MEPNPAPSDAELVARYVHERSDAAFAELVGRYVDLVYATAVRHVGDRHAAEDVTQAVFLLLAGKAAGLGPRVVLPGWLYRAARLATRDAMKQHRRRQRHERAAARAERVEPAADGGPSAELEAALDRLSTTDRDALLLRYWQGLAVGEVARRLGVAENAAAKRLERAVGRLRSRLGGGATAITAGASLATLAAPRAPDGLAAACAAGRGGSLPAARARWPAAAAAVAGLAAVVVAAVVITGPPPKPAPPAVAAVPPPPLGPASPEQRQQVRAAVDRLRHYSPFARMDDWPKAMRTLVTIGRPAVPEIVAELNRADKDAELRAFGFTLRAIGDPRACPALIAALRRTALVSSDLGLHLTDPGVTDFIRTHQIDPSEQDPAYPAFGQAVREIVASLEQITHHSEGKPYRFRGGEVTDAARADCRRRLNQLADAWAKWWAGHHDRLATDADLATLTDGPHDVAALAEAGDAVNGPPFPTGPAHPLGPVQDLWLDPLGDRYDLRAIVSFDRREAFTQLDAFRRLPAETAVELHTSWDLDPPVSPDAVCQQYTVTVGPPPPVRIAGGPAMLVAPRGKTVEVYNLYTIADEVWPVDNRTWDSLPADVAAGRPVVLDPAGPESGFRFVTDGHGGPPTFPATYVVHTAAGGAGLVQMVESSAARRQLHVRFRMATPAVDVGPATVAAMPVAAPFGPVRQVTLPAVAAGAACALTLGTGTIARAPADPAVLERPDDWVRTAGVDVVTTHGYHDPAVLGLRIVAAAVMPVSDDAFDHLASSVVAVAAAHVRIDPDETDGFLLSAAFQPEGPRTAVFVTRDGSAGLVQLLGVARSPASATLRWKLLRGPTAATRP